MQKDNKGFTLIELMIVVSIISILTTMAMPSYQDRIIRTQIKEALILAEFAQDGINEFYKKRGHMPKTNKEAGLPESTKIIGNYTTNVMVENGAIHITLGNKINQNVSGQTLTVYPAIVKGESQVPIAWICGKGSIPDGMISSGDNKTTLEARLLPIECRY